MIAVAAGDKQRNPRASLAPLEVKSILQRTATHLSYADWEAGAGYVDAYSAVRRAFREQQTVTWSDGPGRSGPSPPRARRRSG